nr:hypothetical protein [Tanacetum cinerariifolium]
EKIDSPFQQTSSLKPYVSNVILEKIIIDLEDEVVNLLEKEKAMQRRPIRRDKIATWDGGNSTWGGRGVAFGKEDAATWDGGKGTWGGQARGFGTVPVCVRVQEIAEEGVVLLAGKVV